jgi:hypothetical protein
MDFQRSAKGGVAVNSQPVIELVRPYFPAVIEDFQRSMSEWDAWIPESERLTVEKARPKFMSLRVMALLSARFGRSGSPRVQEFGRMSFLMIDGPDLSVGIRTKKQRENFSTFQSPSETQIELRKTGRLLWAQTYYHIFIGYKTTSGLVPSLRTIAMTVEDESGVVLWKYIIWNAQGGMSPPQEFQPQLMPPPADDLPTPPKVRLKKPKSGGPKAKPKDVG